MTGELLLAYESTRYQVLADDGQLLAECLVGRRSGEADRLLDAHGAAAGVFITAWNPRSEQTDAGQNERADRRLRDELADAGYVLLPHRGVGDDPDWEPEQGWFVIGMDVAAALPVAVAHGQNAIVVVERGGTARLVLTEVMAEDAPAAD